LDAKRFSGPQQFFLAHEFVKRLRPHAVGQRPAREWLILRLDCPKQSQLRAFRYSQSKALTNSKLG
jgi:hypothetical protein